MKVGMLVAPWTKNTCQCGSEYYVTRTCEKVITENDLYCNHCLNAFALDLKTKRVSDLEKHLKGMIEIAEELNYRLRKTDQPEGFYHHIEIAKAMLKEIK